MKLNRLTEEQSQILKLVVEEYYAVLPPAIQVHSLFATHILSNTLHRFGIRTRVLPCRLWCSFLPQKKELVGGFVNYGDREKWNGHVVCLVGDWLVDAALYHLNPSFNYEVPKIIAARVLLPAPGTYARYRVNRETEFIWYRLPASAAAIPQTGYEDYIDRFVDDLYVHIRRLLGYVDEVPAEPLDELATSEAQEDEVPEAEPVAEGEDGAAETDVVTDVTADADPDAAVAEAADTQTETSADEALAVESVSPAGEEIVPAEEVSA